MVAVIVIVTWLSAHLKKRKSAIEIQASSLKQRHRLLHFCLHTALFETAIPTVLIA